MSGIKLKELPDAGVLDDGDFLLMEQRTGTKKVTVGNINKKPNEAIAIINSQLEKSTKMIESSGIYAINYNTLQEAFIALVSNSVLILEKGKTYNLDTAIKLKSKYVKNITIEGNNAILKFTHVGDGLDLSTAYGEYDQNFKIKDLNIVGCDPAYPNSISEYLSEGAGLKINYCYGSVFTNVWVSGFKYGLFSTNGIKNVFNGATSFMRNQYGIYSYGQVFNNNDFVDCKIRENRKYGIYIAMDDTQGNNGAPVANIFTNCLIESNRSYINSSSDTTGTGVYLYRSLDNIFTDCYFENNPINLHFVKNSCGNKFNSCRFEYAFNTGIVAKFEADNFLLTNIIFNNCTHNNLTPTQQTDSFITTTKLEYGIQLLNCIGFRIDRVKLLYSNIYMQNCSQTQGWGGTRNQTISIPYSGRKVDPSEDTANNVYCGISGIGTSNAILKLKGETEITLGSSITNPTTIIGFDNPVNGQILIINSVLLSHPVTIKKQERINTSSIFINSDCILKKYGDQIIFWINYAGKAIEISRSIAE